MRIAAQRKAILRILVNAPESLSPEQPPGPARTGLAPGRIAIRCGRRWRRGRLPCHVRLLSGQRLRLEETKQAEKDRTAREVRLGAFMR